MLKALHGIETLTLFVEDLPTTKRFYQDVFGLDVVFADEVSTVFRFGDLMINLLQAAEADELIEPARIGRPDSGSRSLLTVLVDDADAACAELQRHGVTLLNGPVNRPWGRRTAAFADPAGNVWEIAQELPGS